MGNIGTIVTYAALMSIVVTIVAAVVGGEQVR